MNKILPEGCCSSHQPEYEMGVGELNSFAPDYEEQPESLCGYYLLEFDNVLDSYQWGGDGVGEGDHAGGGKGW